MGLAGCRAAWHLAGSTPCANVLTARVVDCTTTQTATAARQKRQWEPGARTTRAFSRSCSCWASSSASSAAACASAAVLSSLPGFDGIEVGLGVLPKSQGQAVGGEASGRKLMRSRLPRAVLNTQPREGRGRAAPSPWRAAPPPRSHQITTRASAPPVASSASCAPPGASAQTLSSWASKVPAHSPVRMLHSLSRPSAPAGGGEGGGQEGEECV